MATKNKLSTQAFLAGVRDYLPIDASVREIDSQGQPGRPVRFGQFNENTFYQFDADTLCALGHAIEDLALEEADGDIFASFQFLKNIEPHRERYEQLAATIETVTVVGGGPRPRPIRGLRFLPDRRGAVRDYWIVLYEGRREQALVAGRQMAPERLFEDRKFLGLFTFNPQVIARFRQDLLEAAAGRGKSLGEFERLCALDQAAKQIQDEFVRGRASVEQAMQRLLRAGGAGHDAHFADELEKGLAGLLQWRTRLPEMLQRARGH